MGNGACPGGDVFLVAGVSAVALTTGEPVKIKPLPSGFDATGKVSTGGRVLTVGGPLACTTGGSIGIYVTVTQRKPGALARGTWRGTCSGSGQEWLLKKARARGRARFRPGQTEACPAGVGLNGRLATDATQWCGSVLLLRG